MSNCITVKFLLIKLDSFCFFFEFNKSDILNVEQHADYLLEDSLSQQPLRDDEQKIRKSVKSKKQQQQRNTKRIYHQPR